jgi:hypothetical protein
MYRKDAGFAVFCALKKGLFYEGKTGRFQFEVWAGGKGKFKSGNAVS